MRTSTKYLLAVLVLTIAQAAKAEVMEGNAVKAIILDTFADQPDIAHKMVIIANCESGLVHRTADGRFLPNSDGSGARGALQLMLSLHQQEANKQGLDLNLSTDEGYFAYIRYLVETQGFRPWAASRACWQPKIG